ncbi:AraC family ethanolamine operon transcriptional activator [Bradyrhizobium japonicum]|jgi:AraC family transcriptional regulator, ethanolamine operon transcriptional activator|uniref:AraC family ethanolamine operon transcriptional activator n=1 Tax=Bradyrhizobium elkanii TaxID=29448 RepID=A0ABV4FB23_BRAEL|nr:helix-turn-helix domain-containing protein [Bradyrhizobium elkanii]MBP2432235.1 AraC family ethanolamine operon transcriptional activator [Bradyrhizobium elkanii]MCP1734443.1 AraC family ethanolamine operon transcriptional activator [Bradyrhizobium elkanii]MCP1752237.1 AraC family ethanolamine operon transcriptional activator [Bradyrhizobium elkanii]MCP1978010.1 AraC family ethanolamine operon transcriptional activator [Bradyrhizobium elkanii]MCS3569781.1 AraC family ethanolamine operon tra
MLFNALSASPALDLQAYADVDHFRESERYVQASSIPLTAAPPSILRASLSLPSATLSLVRTFPRIINGYELSDRLVFVVPMDRVASARLNGQAVRHSIIVLKGSANCTVFEPEPRLVAILSIPPDHLALKWAELSAGYLLLGLPGDSLAFIQTLIQSTLRFAAHQSKPIDVHQLLAIQGTLFSALDEEFHRGAFEGGKANIAERYKRIIDHIDDAIMSTPASNNTCDELANELGISVRTLHTAAQSICGAGIHQYRRLRQLWLVRQHLRMGYPGLTVKATALAHGFWHMGEFSRMYRAAFGEVPSRTLIEAQGKPASIPCK